VPRIRQLGPLLVLGPVLPLLVAACSGSDGSDRAPGPPPPPSAPEAPTASPPPRPPSDAPVASPAPQAGDTVALPAGTYRVGSRPGTPGRRPRLEADRVEVTLGAFTVDRLPYPNDPALPPRTGVSRPEAATLCEAEGKRLCTEIERERACVGRGEGPYTTGADLDPTACAQNPERCPSDEGVLGMGLLIEEWTSSPVTRGLGNEERSAVVRSAGPGGTDRRCAARDSANPAQSSGERGFRCCAGPVNAVPYPEERARARMRDLAMEDTEARRILASLPEVARFAEGFHLFGGEEALAALARGGKTLEDLHGWEPMQGVLRWAPTPGDELWILAGRDARSSLVVAVYPMPDGTFLHAASFVLEGETAPIAVVHTPSEPTELLWSSCWGCGGEGGAIEYRDDATVVITQR